MAKFHALTVATIQKRPPGRHTDGGNGLYLEVKAGRRDAKDRRPLLAVSLQERAARLPGRASGVFPAVSLKMARERAQAYREAIYRGEDPFKAGSVNPDFRGSRSTPSSPVNAKGWKNAKHRDAMAMTLGDTYCAEHCASCRSTRSKPGTCSRCFSPVWHDKAETARRLRGRIEAHTRLRQVQGLARGRKSRTLARQPQTGR